MKQVPFYFSGNITFAHGLSFWLNWDHVILSSLDHMLDFRFLSFLRGV